jgi:GAF domain-containing protein
MQTYEKASAREAALFRRLARTLFTAKTETDVADALLSAACEVTSRGGAVYLETERGFRRLAATGTGLTLPAETDRLQRASLTVHRHGACAFVHDTLDRATEALLADAVSLAGAALDEVAAKSALRARSRSMADRVAATDERATALAKTVESALLEALRAVLDAKEIEIADGLACDESDLCVSLSLDGTTIGMLRARPRVAGQFGVEQQRAMELVAPKLAIAIALARRIAQGR